MENGKEEGRVKGKDDSLHPSPFKLHPSFVVEYEPDADLRDTEQVPLLEEGGIEAFIRREVLPYTPDAWIKEDATKIGYEISFTRHFYKPQPLRTLEEIRADILAIEKEAEGLLDDLLKGGSK
jgi:type I restriction enzyme M protein